MRKSLVLLLLLVQYFGFAQNELDSSFSQQKSIVEVSDTTKNKKAKKARNPMKASLLATFLPSSGQIYNRKYWKAPIVLGGGITLYLMYDFYNAKHQFYHQILVYKDRGGSPEFIEPYVENNGGRFTSESPVYVANLDQTTIGLRSDGARKQKQQIIIWSSIFYIMQIVDATVDAHFTNFDVSEDLTLNISPATFQTTPWAQGVKLSFTF